LHQAQRIALPRRFSLPMQEIWMLQPRFALRQKKRVFRTLAHPRFRAAFDFLELRAKVAPELAADLVFWREAQLQAHGALAQSGEEGFDEAVAGASSEAVNDEAGPRRRRRRRPRRGGSGGGAGGGAEA
jgi:poly(A) polymerase